MNIYIKILASIFIIILLSDSLRAQSDIRETLTVPLTTPGKAGKLEVSLMRGSIRVIGHAGKDVIIEAISTEEGKKKEKSEPANGMKRLVPPGGGIELTAEENKNNVKISTSFMKRPLNLTIKVPQQFSLKVSAINNGDIVIENVQGEMEVNNINGAIDLSNVSGSAVANTINGNVRANFKTIAESPMAFSSLNGNIDVTFPAVAKFDVKLKSDRGEIFTDYDVAIDKTQPKSTSTSEKGMYKISREDWIQGKVNGGGGEIMMKNMNGNIFVRKAK
jgi:hypothetical protein